MRKISSLTSISSTIDKEIGITGYEIVKSVAVKLPAIDTLNSNIENLQTYSNNTTANVVITNNDVVITNADVITTNADAIQTGLDKVATNADVVTTNNNVVLSANQANNSEVSSSSSQLKAWQSEAKALTSESYASEPLNSFVKTYTSNNDGTFTSTTTNSYSALHYSEGNEIEPEDFITGTGVKNSYVSSVSVGSTTFSQGAVLGEINSDLTVASVTYSGATNISVTNLTSPSAYIYIDSSGNLQQQSTTPTREDWVRKIFTMRIGINVVAGTILGFEYLNNPIKHFANSTRDLFSYLISQGVPFKKEQIITGRAGDLGFDVSAGSFMEFGGTGNIYNPNVKELPAVANTSYTLFSRTAVVSIETDLVKFYDNNGTITPLGSTTVVGHRLYRFSNGNFVIQYGQGNYANMTLAKSGALVEAYVLNPQLKNATFFGWWFIESTATNTGGTTLTEFKEYTIGIQGGSSSGLAGCLLKGNNLSDLLDAVAARANLGLGATDSPTFAGGTYNGPVSSTAGDINLITNTALSDTAATLTAAQLIGGEFTITPSVARIQTLDTAANIISALSGSVDNSNFTFTIVNLAAFDVTIATAAGVTLVGNMIVNDGSATFRVRRLNSSTVSVTRIESGSSSATSQIMIVTDQKSNGTDGGDFTSGAWRTRDLNTITTNTIPGAFVNTSNNRINLPAGSYLITASAPAYEVGKHKLKLLNITDSLDAIIGSSEFTGLSSNCTTRSFIADVLNITSDKDFFLQHRCDTTNLGNGFGRSSSFSVAESYTDIKIEKIG